MRVLGMPHSPNQMAHTQQRRFGVIFVTSLLE